LPPLASPLPAQSEDLRKICEHKCGWRRVPPTTFGSSHAAQLLWLLDEPLLDEKITRRR
jgi:hypothetical protein